MFVYPSRLPGLSVWLWVLLLAAFFGLACTTADAPQMERYARRLMPPSGDGWTTEAAVEARKQGMWEVSLFPPGAEATPEQQRAADDLVERSFAAAKEHGWHDIENAFAEGWVRTRHDPHHYRHDEYLLDDRVLDPNRPEFLMYHDLDGVNYLTGLMFFSRTRSEYGEQIGGPLTIWHYHTWRRAQCAVKEMIPSGWATPDGSCEEGVAKYRSGEMLHVWLIDRPAGPFSAEMHVSSEALREGIEKRVAEHGF